METVLIIIIVGLASAYLVRKFYRSLHKTEDMQCGCSCTSCPSEPNNCDKPPTRPLHHIK